MERWAINIDIEGFSALYGSETQVLLSLGSLMEGIYLIGKRCYPESPDRIFAHQIGDGFIIVSNFGSDSLAVPVAIAIALMQHVAATGRLAKATIAEGELADIKGCYPQTIRDALQDNGRVRMGRGLMTIFPVMGTALIRAVGLSKNSPSGSLLTIRKEDQPRLPAGVRISEIKGSYLEAIDWIHSNIELVQEIQQKASLNQPGYQILERIVTDYCRSKDLKDEWKGNTLRLLSLCGRADGT